MNSLFLASFFIVTTSHILLLYLASARDCFQDFFGYEDGKFRNRIEPLISRNTTMAIEIAKRESSKLSLQEISSYFESIRVRRESEMEDDEFSCDKKLDSRSQSRTKFFGFGNLTGCVALFESDKMEDAKPVIEAIEDLNEDMRSFGKNVTAGYDRLDWETVFANDAIPRISKADSIRDCTAYRSIGYRLGGKWGVGIILYKNNFDYNAALWKKILLTEYVSVEDGEVTQFKYSLPICSEDLEVTGLKNGTAIIEYWASLVDWNHDRNNKIIEEHYGLRNALAKSERDKELIQDSRAASNTAILMLPTILTLVPISIVENIDFKFIIMYSIATDIFSVTPILIKGFELLNFSKKRYYSITSLIEGSAARNETGLSQAWPAVCAIKPDIRTDGLVHITIGFSAMSIGFLLEIFIFWRRKMEGFSFIQEKKEEEENGLLWYWKNTDAEMNRFINN